MQAEALIKTDSVPIYLGSLVLSCICACVSICALISFIAGDEFSWPFCCIDQNNEPEFQTRPPIHPDLHRMSFT